MQLSDYFCYGIFWLILIGFAIWWLLMRLGYDKRWFVIPSAPLISRGFYFFLPTFVLGFAFALVDMLRVANDPHNSNLGTPFLSIGVGFWALGFVFAYFEPSWLSPDWYRWLKREHGDILLYLEREANRLGRAAWLRRVRTQKDLEAWVHEVREQYKRQ